MPGLTAEYHPAARPKHPPVDPKLLVNYSRPKPVQLGASPLLLHPKPALWALRYLHRLDQAADFGVACPEPLVGAAGDPPGLAQRAALHPQTGLFHLGFVGPNLHRAIGWVLAEDCETPHRIGFVDPAASLLSLATLVRAERLHPKSLLQSAYFASSAATLEALAAPRPYAPHASISRYDPSWPEDHFALNPHYFAVWLNAGRFQERFFVVRPVASTGAGSFHLPRVILASIRQFLPQMPRFSSLATTALQLAACALAHRQHRRLQDQSPRPIASPQFQRALVSARLAQALLSAQH